jgi:hypothetical protein
VLPVKALHCPQQLLRHSPSILLLQTASTSTSSPAIFTHIPYLLSMPLPTAENLYGYDASLPAAILFSVLNSILLGNHAYLSLWRPWRLCGPNRSPPTNKHRHTICLFVAALFATVGYTTRCSSISSPDSIGLYATSGSYIVLSPIFICAALYWQLKHLVILLLPPGPRQKVLGLGPRWLGRVFITSDVLSFLTQGAGSGIASAGNWEGTEKEIGEGVLIGGLALQLATFTVYLGFLGVVLKRVGRNKGPGTSREVKKVLVGMGVASVLVQVSTLWLFMLLDVGGTAKVDANAGQIRTLFRLVEFALGIDGYPFQHEWCLYVFESAPMVIALTALAWWHPVIYLQGKQYYDESSGTATPEKGTSGAQSVERAAEV